jgi:long-chain fatty acid transport protein
MKRSGFLLLFALIGSAGSVYGSGLAIPEQGAAAMGLSAAMTARSQDLSSIFYNPAGLDYVQGTEVFLGLTPITPSHKYEGAGVSKEANKKTFVPPQLYIAHRYNSKTVLGLGIYAPFGLGTDWGNTWNGRYSSTFAEVNAIFFNPTASFQLHKMVTLGLGISFIYSKATIQKMVDTGLQLYPTLKNSAVIANPVYDTQFSLQGDGGGFNYNLGLMIKPSEKMQFGVSYRAKTDVVFKQGKAYFNLPVSVSTDPATNTALLNGLRTKLPYIQNGSTTLHLPSMLDFGLFYKFTDSWDASADIDLIQWSNYDQLIINLEKQLPAAQVIQDKNWKNTSVFRLGTSYSWTNSLILRGGVLYDQNPVPDSSFDPQLPDANRVGISAGFGYTVSGVRLDFSYMFLKFASRDKDNFVGYSDVAPALGVVDANDQAALNNLVKGTYPVGNGTYKSSANMFSVSASYKF